MKSDSMTALKASLLSCHTCGQVSRPPSMQSQAHARCPRCGASLHWRKPNSISRTWALWLTAVICYIPANALPVMTVISFGEGDPDTILSGVMVLIEHDSWALAALVFFASFCVPLTKLVMIAFLLISVQKKSTWRPRDRTRVYRVVEAVGRWSMLDIFMVSILIALVKLGDIATIEAGAGGSFFAAVVIITMLASMSFDPKLIWDKAEGKHS